jgi:hypothetical protein
MRLRYLLTTVQPSRDFVAANFQAIIGTTDYAATVPVAYFLGLWVPVRHWY